jgi:hypothetical protein
VISPARCERYSLISRTEEEVAMGLLTHAPAKGLQRHRDRPTITPPGLSFVTRAASHAAMPFHTNPDPRGSQAGNQGDRAEPRFGRRFVPLPVEAPAPLSVNRPDDSFEHEANRHADAIARQHLAWSAPDMRSAAVVPVVEVAPRVHIAMAPHAHHAPPGAGQPLDPATRSIMEAHFRSDFRGVRIHSDATATDAARSVNALAFTVGRDIFFDTAQFGFDTRHGHALLAHELAHVVQQQRHPIVVQRQVAARPANDRVRREFVQDTVGFFQRSAEFYRDPNVRITPAVFERLINSWYLMVVDRERQIAEELGGDAALRETLRGAYTSAIRTLISRAAVALGRSEKDLYNDNRGRIPIWAWDVPSHLIPGITTPIPIGREASARTGAVQFAANGFDVTIAPDNVDRTLTDHARTRLQIGWRINGYRWDRRTGVITSFTPPAPPGVRIQTSFPPIRAGRPQLRPDVISGYGRGTTTADIAGSRVTPASRSLGFHEGSHGFDFLAFIRAHPAPAFHGRVGMTVQQFRAAIAQWRNALAVYQQQAQSFSVLRTDCVGTTIDDFDRAEAGAGRAVELQCREPTVGGAP